MKVLFSIPFLLIYALLVTLVLVYRGHRRSAMSLLLLLTVFLLLLGTPFTTLALLRVLGGYEPVSDAGQFQRKGIQAIVVLGGGYYHSPETGEHPVAGNNSLQRVRYAARLYRQTGLPVFLGGIEAEAMARSFREDYGIPPVWVERQSRTTAENARLAGDILFRQGISRIALVTDAWHMGRAERMFARQGFQVMPATTAFPLGDVHARPWSLKPQPGLFVRNMYGISELMGQVYYRIRFSGEPPAPAPAPDAVPGSGN